MRMRILHDNQTGAILRLQRARTLLAEASGLMRALDREVKGTERSAAVEDRQAREIEAIESEVARVMADISRYPVGGSVT